MPQNALGIQDESLLAEKPPRQIFVNLRRNNLRVIRVVLNAGETLSEFVRLAVLAEVARRRSEDDEAIRALDAV